MNTAELSESSDSSDEDYVPDKKEEYNVSEVESDGEVVEDELSDNEEKNVKSRKRTKQTGIPRKKQKNDKPNGGLKEVTEEEKKKVDDVWADFMRDTGFQSRKDRYESSVVNKPKQPPSKSSDASKSKLEEKTPEKVKITQVFKFAGEDVSIEKEVSRDSTEARLLSNSTPECNKNSKGRNKNNLSGISGILSQLGKKPKISTLEKSKLDWDQFKKEENLAEELQTHNKGKDGYLEKQDFLQRADLRRFEIEKEIRTIERNKRPNNIL